jgi:hypothetical protein
LIGAGPLLLKNGTLSRWKVVGKFKLDLISSGYSQCDRWTTKEKGKVLLVTVQAAPEGIVSNLLQTG